MTEPAENKLAYVKTFETKIIRRKHRIGFSERTNVRELINSLELVPEWSIVDKVETDDDGITTITFHEEVGVKE